MQEFKGITNVDLNESDEFIFTQYVQWGGDVVRSMNSVLSDADLLATADAKYQQWGEVLIQLYENEIGLNSLTAGATARGGR